MIKFLCIFCQFKLSISNLNLLQKKWEQYFRVIIFAPTVILQLWSQLWRFALSAVNFNSLLENPGITVLRILMTIPPPQGPVRPSGRTATCQPCRAPRCRPPPAPCMPPLLSYFFLNGQPISAHPAHLIMVHVFVCCTGFFISNARALILGILDPDFDLSCPPTTFFEIQYGFELRSDF